MRHARIQTGITRTEVAIIVVICGGLLGMLLPAIHDARVRSRREACARNLGQIALGLEAYGKVYAERFPYGTWVNDGLVPERRWSWYAGAWGPVTNPQVGLLVDLGGEWRSPARASRPASDPPPEFEEFDLVRLPRVCCPSNPVYSDRDRQDASSYVGMAGLGVDAARLSHGDPRAGVWGYDRQTRLDEIVDGDSTTILLAETGLDCGPWMAGGPATVRGLDPGDQPSIGPRRPFGGLHPGGGQVATVDGSTRFISQQVDPEVLALQVAIADTAKNKERP